MGIIQEIDRITEEVKVEMCEQYCKHPSSYSPEEWEAVWKDICNKCPLLRL